MKFKPGDRCILNAVCPVHGQRNPGLPPGDLEVTILNIDPEDKYGSYYELDIPGPNPKLGPWTWAADCCLRPDEKFRLQQEQGNWADCP